MFFTVGPAACVSTAINAESLGSCHNYIPGILSGLFSMLTQVVILQKQIPCPKTYLILSATCFDIPFSFLTALSLPVFHFPELLVIPPPAPFMLV